MAVFLAYFSVVLIWATTPLAIQWSSDSLTFVAAATARLVLALAVAVVVALLLHGIARQRPPLFWQQRTIYFAASLSIFPNMPLIYWAAQYIPSGLIAVLFAMSPFATGLISLVLFKQNPFTVKRCAAPVMAMVGLAIIFHQQFRINANALYGVVGILLSCVLFSGSSVWVKHLTARATQSPSSFQQAVGAMLFALPGTLVTWWWMDGEFPVQLSMKSLGAVVYLAVIGSLVGLLLFFYILQRLSASTVSLITLMTPVMAILLGRYVAQEAFSLPLLIGVGIVLVSLLLYLPWAPRTWFESLSQGLQKGLRRPPPDSENLPETLLNQAREDAVRFK